MSALSPVRRDAIATAIASALLRLREADARAAFVDWPGLCRDVCERYQAGRETRAQRRPTGFELP